MKKPSKRWGPYWLHTDSWYRLFPPLKKKSNKAQKL